MTRVFITILAFFLLAAPAAGQSHGGHPGGRQTEGGSRVSAPIDGFRSARFGLDEASTRVAISRDFGPVPVMRAIGADGRITLSAHLPDPFPAGGPARGAWTLAPGRGLEQIELAWPAGDDLPAGELADAAALLRDHLASYAPDRPRAIAERILPTGSRRAILTDAQGRRATLYYKPAVAGHREIMTLKYTLPDDTTVARDPSQER